MSDLPDVTLGGKFNGPVYDAAHDHARLTGQLKRVYDCMADQAWRTLDEIHKVTGDPAASISAQLRHLRKARFGGFVVDKRPRGDRDRGLWEYRLAPPEVPAVEPEPVSTIEWPLP
jgi:hypothetical protein